MLILYGENLLVHYGWPEKILTDQGKSFENNLFRELCSLAKVKKLCTSPYHPETNGQCEHFNATLISMLGTLPNHAKKNWQEWITTLTHAYNCTVLQNLTWLSTDVWDDMIKGHDRHTGSSGNDVILSCGWKKRLELSI